MTTGRKIALVAILIAVISSFHCYIYTDFGFMAGRFMCGISPIDLGYSVSVTDRLMLIVFHTSIWLAILYTPYVFIKHFRKK